MRILFLVPVFLIVVIMSSCTSTTTTTTDCTGITPTYTNDIASVMNNSCALSGCHNSSSKSAGIDLSTYDKVKTESAKSNFLKSIKHQSGVAAMPQGLSKLSDATILNIECWINNNWPQ